MRDTNSRLHDGLTPRRALHPAFTDHTFNIINQRRQEAPRSWRHSLQGAFKMQKLSSTPLLTAAIALAILGGGTLTASKLPAIEAWLNGTKTLASGNTLVSVDTKDCAAKVINGDALDAKAQTAMHWELKAGSSVTPTDLVSSVRENCQEELDYSLAKRQFPELLDFSGSTTVEHDYGAITGLSDNQISLNNLNFLRATTNQLPAADDTLAFAIAPNVQVFANDQKVDLTTIKPGDQVMLIVRYEQDYATLKAANPARLDTSQASIVGLIKVEAGHAMGSRHLTQLEQKAGHDYVRLDICNTTPDGFCRTTQFVQ